MKMKKMGLKQRLAALLFCLCMFIGLMPMTVFAGETKTYNAYSDDAIAGGADSQVYAVTIKNVDGEDLHYVYSPNAIHYNDLMERIRAGLEEPYKSLIPTYEEESGASFLRFSRDQDKYEGMNLNWAYAEAVADALISGEGSVTIARNDAAISVTDISEIHAGENIVSNEQLSEEEFYTNPPELGQLASGQNRVETITGYIHKETPDSYYDVFNIMHVTQIYSMNVMKSVSTTDPIDLPVRVLEEGDKDYIPVPELSASFAPDSAVAVGEFNKFQGLAIDYCKEDTEEYGPVSEGYDMQALYTVTIPLENYQGETLSGTLTIPLPEGYDGATARIKDGASASSYTEDTASFPVTLDVENGMAEIYELVIEYREALEPVQPPVITAGANSTWQQGGKDGLSFTSDAEFADFIKVQVDGKDLDASDYTVREGSTIVTLKADYLGTLSVGEHTLFVVSANGTAVTKFTIAAA